MQKLNNSELVAVCSQQMLIINVHKNYSIEREINLNTKLQNPILSLVVLDNNLVAIPTQFGISIWSSKYGKHIKDINELSENKYAFVKFDNNTYILGSQEKITIWY